MMKFTTTIHDQAYAVVAGYVKVRLIASLFSMIRPVKHPSWKANSITPSIHALNP